MKSYYVSILFVLGMGMAGSTARFSEALGSPSSSFNLDELNGKGCCSHHGGQDSCGASGKWICRDGWTSSCGC